MSVFHSFQHATGFVVVVVLITVTPSYSSFRGFLFIYWFFANHASLDRGVRACFCLSSGIALLSGP